MTKAIRVENADNSSFKVLVQTWDKGYNGAPDVMAGEVLLPNPTDMAGANGSLYLTNTRYVVVKEAPTEPVQAETHVDRMVNEKLKLDHLYAKMMAFYGTETYHALDQSKKDLLSEQRTAMMKYSEVLGKRIALELA